jgi:hypothetical protein
MPTTTKKARYYLQQAADELGISRWSLIRLVREGKGRAHRLNYSPRTRYYWHPEDIDALREDLKVKAR